MAMAGWKTGDMLEGIEGIMNLAAVSGALRFTAEDTAEAIGLMANAASSLPRRVRLCGPC